MPSPDAPSAPQSRGSGRPDDGDLPSPPLSACVPVRGLRSRPVTGIAVDDDLVWVAPVPMAAAGAARTSSPAALLHLSVLLTHEHAVAHGVLEAPITEAELVDAAARLVAGYLDDLPELPLVGEPFGGEEGTD